MKMNGETKAYIHSLLCAKAGTKLSDLTKRIDALKAKQEATYTKLSAECEKIGADAVKKVLAVMKKLGVEPETDYRGEAYEVTCRFNNTAGATTFHAEIDTLSDEKTKIERAIMQKQTEIIAKLTLGGTAADLERLIAEVTF